MRVAGGTVPRTSRAIPAVHMNFQLLRQDSDCRALSDARTPAEYQKFPTETRIGIVNRGQEPGPAFLHFFWSNTEIICACRVELFDPQASAAGSLFVVQSPPLPPNGLVPRRGLTRTFECACD